MKRLSGQISDDLSFVRPLKPMTVLEKGTLQPSEQSPSETTPNYKLRKLGNKKKD
jgi:hypothetical protein